MIEIVKLTGLRVEESAKLKKILSRGVGLNSEILSRADAIIREVRERGDAALIEFTARFDGVKLSPESLRVDRRTIEELAAQVDGDLIAAMEAVGVPAGPVNDVAEALSEPQIAARGLQVAPEGIAGLRTPIRFGRSRLTHDRAAPALGDGEWRFAGDARP